VGLSEAEIAERSGCPVERIEELVDLGILVPREEEGPFSAKDVHRVRLMQAFEDAGIDLELIARGVASGKVSYENLGLYLPEPAALSRTAAELATEVGRSPELITRLLREFGIAQPGPDGRLREDEVTTLKELLGVWAAADDDELARLARVYGQNIRKVVSSDLELAGTTIFARLREEGYTDDELREIAGAAGLRLMNLGEQLMLWLRGRHLEHEVLSVTVQTTEDYLQELGLAPKRTPSPPAIAFLDLSGYTALTEERGDEAGADLADRLATLVHEAARPHGGNPVKWLGDGGNVVYRDGDYFGRTVNAASRIADYARPGEVLVSGEVKERWGGDGVRFDEIGPVALKGLREELTLYAASRA